MTGKHITEGLERRRGTLSSDDGALVQLQLPPAGA